MLAIKGSWCLDLSIGASGTLAPGAGEPLFCGQTQTCKRTLEK